jgi:HK97 family phage major capsid protein
MSRNLNEDAIISLGDKWAMAAAVAFAEKEDDCGFNGTGTSTYGLMTGLLTKLTDAANAASLYTATGHATLGSLTVGDFESVMGLLPEYPGIKPAWFMHKTVYHASMAVLKRTAGGVSMAEMVQGGQPEYAGYPVVFTQKMPRASSVTTGVTGIIFGDLSMSSKFGDRRGRTFETGLDGNDFSKQLLSMLCTERFDINNHTIVDPRNSSNPGPVIGLKLG